MIPLYSESEWYLRPGLMCSSMAWYFRRAVGYFAGTDNMFVPARLAEYFLGDMCNEFP